MKIKRTIDGREVEFELTGEELYQAFVEQELQFDIANVRIFFEDYTNEDFQNEYGMSRQEVEGYFEDIACQLRRNINKYDMNFDYALSYAISDVLK